MYLFVRPVPTATGRQARARRHAIAAVVIAVLAAADRLARRAGLAPA